MKLYPLLTLLLFPCLFQSQETSNPQNIEENADSLIDLTEENFDQNVFFGNYDRWFIMFYASWCPHCQDATPILNQLAKALDSKVKIGRVDCDANPEIRNKYSIQGVPTFLYFYQDEIHQYEGDRTVEAWTEFIDKGFKKIEKTKPEDIKAVEEETHSLNSQDRPDLKRERENPEDVFRNSEFLVELTDTNFDSQVKDDERWFVIFYLPWCRHCQDIMPAFDELANSLQGQVNFGKVDCDTEDALREKYSIHSYPAFLYLYKGEIRQYEGDKTVEAWAGFVNQGYTTAEMTEAEEEKIAEEPANLEENLFQDNLTEGEQQLEIPEATAQAPQLWQSDALEELTDVNFNYKVLTDSERKWFVMFYALWCPRCHEAMPDFIKMAESLQGDVSFGRVDCDANPYIRNRYSIQDHPTLLYFYKGGVRQYEGDRTVEAWIDFVNRGFPTEVEENKVIEETSTPIPETQPHIEKENIAQQPPIEERPQIESSQNNTQQPESIDYIVQQPPVQARPEFESPENITQQFPIPESPQHERLQNITQEPEKLENYTLQPPLPQPENFDNITQSSIPERPLHENFENITQQSENLYNISQSPPIQEKPQDEIPQNYFPHPLSPENLTQAPVQETPQPEILEGQSNALIDLNEANFDDNVLSDNGRRWFVMFYAPWCPHCHDAMPTFGELANSLKDRASVARVDCEANPGLRDKYSIQGYPTFLFFYKGEIHQYEGLRTVEAWTEFVTHDYKGTEAQEPEENKAIEANSTPMPLEEPTKVPQERNPEIPAEEPNFLIDLNKNNFNTRVFGKEDDRWLVMFYAPWCPHCKHAMPTFKELAKALKGHANVGRVDCDANPELRNRFSINEYPTFLFFSHGEIRKFEGERTIQAWSGFVNEGYKKVDAIEENVHGISLVESKKSHRTRFFTPAVLIVGAALVGAMLLFCLLAISHRKHEEDTTVRHYQLEDTSVDDDTRIHVD